jgi:hypothetical protein
MSTVSRDVVECAIEAVGPNARRVKTCNRTAYHGAAASQSTSISMAERQGFEPSVPLAKESVTAAEERCRSTEDKTWRERSQRPEKIHRAHPGSSPDFSYRLGI